MNIAFPAALVAAIILPGIIARYSYARGSWGWSSPTSMRGIADEFILGLIFSIGLHALWLPLASLVKEPDLTAAIAFANGSLGNDYAKAKGVIEAFSLNVGHVAAYFLSLYAAAAGAGNLAHRLVRRFRLDHRTPAFRFSNYWFYMLSGEAASFDKREPEPIAGVYLSTVIDQGGTSYLYRGIVCDFHFDKDGCLSTIVLTHAHRRLLVDPSLGDYETREPNRYHDIEGDFFIVKYAEMKTLNLDYFTIELEAIEDAPLPVLATTPTLEAEAIA